MKKTFLTLVALIACTLFVSAQESQNNGSQEYMDKLQQEPPRQTRREVEKTAKISSENIEQNKKIALAKEKKAQKKALKAKRIYEKEQKRIIENREKNEKLKK